MEEEQKNITIVKKGLFYYLFQLIALPFKGIFFLMKFGWKYLSIYLGWCKEYQKYRIKQKDLNKILSRSKLNGEII